jgi:hypothetical protein
MSDCTVYKGILRQDVPDSAEYWAKVAGTQDAVERSYQVNSPMVGWGGRTGMGNERLTKQMRIEHDVFKELKTFQMILIEKNPMKLDAVQLWTSFSK